ncbi:MAG: hypothetical protein ACPGLV_01350, partial [Bacteroidia bacterium]
MKNLLTLLALSTVILLGGCKKGEEDPAIAFSSRDARITGDWNLTSGSMSIVTSKINSVDGSTAQSVTEYKQTYEISGGKASYNYVQIVNEDEVENSKVNYDDFDFSITLSLMKDASYVNNFSGQLVGANGFPKELRDKSTGSWSWINSNKNKVGISFNGADTYANDLISGDYTIKR